MRVKLTLEQPAGKRQWMPVNYNYPIYRMIYGLISKGSEEHARRLHDEGGGTGSKRFRFFTFSRLRTRKMKLEGRMMKLLSQEAELVISSASKNTMHNLISGLLKTPELKLRSRDGEAVFRKAMIEDEETPPVLMKREMRFKLLSPVVVSRKKFKRGVPHQRREREEYIHPHDEEYAKYLIRNLESKFIAYLAACGEPIIEWEKKAGKLINDVRVIGKPREVLIAVKEGTKSETKVKGYMYEGIEISGYKGLVHFAYDTGVGKLNSMGFGCVSV